MSIDLLIKLFFFLSLAFTDTWKATVVYQIASDLQLYFLKVIVCQFTKYVHLFSCRTLDAKIISLLKSVSTFADLLPLSALRTQSTQPRNSLHISPIKTTMWHFYALVSGCIKEMSYNVLISEFEGLVGVFF